jgi:hypothetical protein
MRVLLGGLVGAAASAAAWFFLEYVTKHELGWLAIAVGLVTGLCVNAGAPKGAPQSYGRAALAVALALLAIVGGRAVYAQVMQNMSQVTTVAPAEATKPAGAASGQAEQGEVEESADDPAEAANVQTERQATGIAAGGARMPKPTVNSYKELEVVWMALAALAAYLTGKGSGTANPVVVETAPDGTAPA